MTKKKRSPISNSIALAVILALLANGLIVYIIMSISSYTSVQKKIFVMALAAIVIIALLINLLFLLGYGKKFKWARKVFIGVSTLFIIVLGVGSYYISRLNTNLNALIDTNDIEKVDYSFITLRTGQTLDNLTASSKIGYVQGLEDFEKSVGDQVISHSSVVKVVKYENYNQLLDDFLVNDAVDVIVVPKQYARLAETYDDEYQTKMSTAAVLDTFNINVASSNSTGVKVLEEPFSILIIGVNGNLSDSIILVTVNPQTLHVTMTSIARDSYVPIACYSNNSYDKINHSRGRSRQCLIDTVENFLDVDIDFYFETDFYALVKIVDVLGGLEIDSPIEFAGSFPTEANPNIYEGVTVPKGLNLLTGKQVLTFARERKHFLSGDFQRQLNQQYVIKQLAHKIIDESKRDVNKLIDVLGAAGNNITMNLSMSNDISPLAGYAINNISASPVDAMSTFVIESMQISGSTPNINGMSVIVPFKRSVDDIKSLIKANLSTEVKLKNETSFSFSINKPYKSSVNTDPSKYWGGELMYPPNYNPNDGGNETPPSQESFTIPDFTKMTYEEAVAWGNANSVIIKKVVIDNTHPSFQDNFADGQIIFQSINAGEYLEKPNNIQLSVVSKTQTPVEPVEPTNITLGRFTTANEAAVFASKYGLKYNPQCLISGVIVDSSKCSSTEVDPVSGNPEEGRIMTVGSEETFKIYMKPLEPAVGGDGD